MRLGSFFVVTVAAVALIAWFAPTGSEPAPAPAAQAQNAAGNGKPTAAAQSDRWQVDEVVLDRDKSGHFYAEVEGGVGSVMMLVDTGASVVALTRNDAAIMGVDWHENDVRPVARGASGDVYGVPVTIERLDVGGIEARRVKAVVVPEGLDVSLLGQSFLSKINRVEVTSDKMVLHD